MNKVTLSKPPIDDPHDWIKEHPIEYHVISINGSKVKIQESFYPKTKPFTVKIKNVCDAEIWHNAREKWHTERQRVKNKEEKQKEYDYLAPKFPCKTKWRSGVNLNDINVNLTSIFYDNSIYREINNEYDKEVIEWNEYWKSIDIEFRREII